MLNTWDNEGNKFTPTKSDMCYFCQLHIFECCQSHDANLTPWLSPNTPVENLIRSHVSFFLVYFVFDPTQKKSSDTDSRVMHR